MSSTSSSRSCRSVIAASLALLAGSTIARPLSLLGELGDQVQRGTVGDGVLERLEPSHDVIERLEDSFEVLDAGGALTAPIGEVGVVHPRVLRVGSDILPI